MPRKPLIRRLLPLPLAVALAAPASAAPSAAPPDGAEVAAEEPGPVHAGNTFGWYPARWREEWETGRLGSNWKVAGPGQARIQHGMLTLNTWRFGTLRVTRTGPGQDRGRWETRIRSKEFERGHARYRVMAELIPAGDRRQHCGARNVSLGTYKHGDSRFGHYIRTLPDNTFHSRKGWYALGDDRWHTLAVEVTPRRISWFVDAKVIATERRADALSGVPFTVRFTMRSQGTTMNLSRMQMDWLRYWPLDNPNDKSIEAPRPTRGTYRDAC